MRTSTRARACWRLASAPARSACRCCGRSATTASSLSIERREDFADIARANVESFFGAPHPAWEVRIGDFDEHARWRCRHGTIDRVVLDMLAPWENLEAAAHALAPGGVFLAYVATTTQLSRLAEELKDTGDFTEPRAWETMARTWHLEGLAVRPDHRMVGHTGFLLSSRRMAPGVEAPIRHRRPQGLARADRRLDARRPGGTTRVGQEGAQGAGAT